MNILPRDKQIAVISALTEGCSVRATRKAIISYRVGKRKWRPSGQGVLIRMR